MPKKHEKMEAWLAPKWEPIKQGNKVRAWVSDKGHHIHIALDFLESRVHTKSAKLIEDEKGLTLHVDMEHLPPKESAIISPNATKADKDMIMQMTVDKGDKYYDIYGSSRMLAGDVPVFSRRMVQIPEDFAAEALAQEVGAHWEKGERLGHILANSVWDLPDDSPFRKSLGLKPGEWMSFLGKKDESDIGEDKKNGGVTVKDSLLFRVHSIPPEKEVAKLFDELKKDLRNHPDPIVADAVMQLMKHYKKRGQKPPEDNEVWLEDAFQEIDEEE